MDIPVKNCQMECSRRGFLKSAAAGAAALGLGAFEKLYGMAAAKPSGKRPNILFIMSDDHACGAISAYGSVVNQTPNIDRIAKEGAILLRNACGNSICAPSRATILTGKHSHINGVTNNVTAFDGSQQTFPKLFQQAGYMTAIVGKWHLKSEPTGFDYWDVLPGQGQYYNPVFINKDGKRNLDGYNADLVADLTIDYLKRTVGSGKPFMVMCQFKAPHRPWLPNLKYLHLYDDVEIPEPATLFDNYFERMEPIKKQKNSIAKDMTLSHDLQVRPVDPNDEAEAKNDKTSEYYNSMNSEQRTIWDAAFEKENEEFQKEGLIGNELTSWKYQRYIKNYLRCVASVDENVGRLLKYLDDAKIAENTIIVYCSDQGFFLGEHGLFDKRFIYDPSLSMPFVIRWPKQIKDGTKISELTQNIDFAPTLLDAAGIEVPDDMQGCSFLPLLKGKHPADWRKSLYYHYYDKSYGCEPHEGVVTDRYKLIHFYHIDEWEFYDRQTDPYEMASRYFDPYYSKQVVELKTELIRLKGYYKVPK